MKNHVDRAPLPPPNSMVGLVVVRGDCFLKVGCHRRRHVSFGGEIVKEKKIKICRKSEVKFKQIEQIDKGMNKFL